MEMKFEKVWYRSSEKAWSRLLAMEDSGILIVKIKSMEYDGKSTKIIFSNVKSVSLCKQGSDFVNKWVKIEYINEEDERVNAYFADGRFWGWSGIFGGTKTMFMVIEQLLGNTQTISEI